MYEINCFSLTRFDHKNGSKKVERNTNNFFIIRNCFPYVFKTYEPTLLLTTLGSIPVGGMLMRHSIYTELVSILVYCNVMFRRGLVTTDISSKVS